MGGNGNRSDVFADSKYSRDIGRRQPRTEVLFKHWERNEQLSRKDVSLGLVRVL